MTLLDLTPEEYFTELRRRFPIIMRDCYCGAYPSPGWREYLMGEFEKLEALAKDGVDPIQITQVKSKFAAACVYRRGGTDEQQLMVHAIEDAVSLLCEWCGAMPSKVRQKSSGYVVRECDDCERMRK